VFNDLCFRQLDIYLARLLDITINNATIPSDWKKTIVVSIYKGGVPIASLELQTRQFNLSSLQANGTRYRIIPEENLGKKDWFFEGQHGYSCESQVITVFYLVCEAIGTAATPGLSCQLG
jgi:hypothetical protein